MTSPSIPKDASAFAAGQVFSHYKLVRRIGRGGFGEVWESVDQRFGRKVAIKFLLPRYKDDKKAIKRFKAEAVFSTLLTHASIVQLLDTGQREDGAHYHVMEFLEGKLLSALLEEADARKTTIGMPRAAHIAWQIAIVLVALHLRNIIHRDLKPHNLMLVQDPLVPGGLRVKILDFGIAKLSDEDAAEAMDLGQETTTGAHLGSPIIMAREQWRTGEPLTPAVDVYALGCILYKMLAGTYPFEGTPNELRIHHELIEPTPLIKEDSSVPPAISDLVQRMLAKDPAARPTMAEVLDELGRILNLATSAAGPMVSRPTGEMDALIAELATGSTGTLSSPTQTATQDGPAGDERSTDPVPQANTSARHGQQITSNETKARRQQRRRWMTVGTACVVLCASGLVAWRTLRAPGRAQPSATTARLAASPELMKPPAEPQAPDTKPPPLSTPPSEPNVPANRSALETTAASIEPKTHHGKAKSACPTIEITNACVFGPLSDDQKTKTVSALREAMRSYSKTPARICETYSLSIAGEYKIQSTKGLSSETSDNFAKALRAFLRLPRLPGELGFWCT